MKKKQIKVAVTLQLREHVETSMKDLFVENLGN